MRRLAAVVALCVLLAGCSCQEVNEHLPFPYERQDDTLEVMGKSLGNTVVVPLEAAMLGGFYLFFAILSGVASSGQRISGSIDKHGVHVP